MRCKLRLLVPVLEPCILRHKAEFHIINFTRTVFRHDKERQAADVVAFGILAGVQIVFRTVYEADDVGILLDGAGLAEVGELGALGC